MSSRHLSEKAPIDMISRMLANAKQCFPPSTASRQSSPPGSFVLAPTGKKLSDFFVYAHLVSTLEFLATAIDVTPKFVSIAMAWKEAIQARTLECEAICARASTFRSLASVEAMA
jgi:hypothetical protein